jgi:hypothetical protein
LDIPQQSTVAPERTAQVILPPALTSTALPIPLTRTGTELSVVVPSPSCPAELLPQHSIVPSLSSAQLWAPPAAIETATGVAADELTAPGDEELHTHNAINAASSGIESLIA